MNNDRKKCFNLKNGIWQKCIIHITVNANTLESFPLKSATKDREADGMGFFEIGSHKLFSQAGFKPYPPALCLLSS
jgi:hypothetical protein